MKITSSTHAMSLTSYAVLVLLGGGWATRSIPSTALTKAQGEAFVSVWAMIVVLAGFTALVSALIIPRFRVPRSPLRWEFAGCILISACLFIYVQSISPSSAGVTILLSIAFFAGPLIRALQIAFELRKIRLYLNPDHVGPLGRLTRHRRPRSESPKGQ